MGAFDFESELFVEGNSRLVVGIDLKFDAPDVQPVLGEVYHRRHEFGSDALTLEVVMHRHAEAGRMSQAILTTVQADIADDFTLNLCYQKVYAAIGICQALLPEGPEMGTGVAGYS